MPRYQQIRDQDVLLHLFHELVNFSDDLLLSPFLRTSLYDNHEHTRRQINTSNVSLYHIRGVGASMKSPFAAAVVAANDLTKLIALGSAALNNGCGLSGLSGSNISSYASSIYYRTSLRKRNRYSVPCLALAVLERP